MHISFTIKSSCCLHLTWSNQCGVIDVMNQKELRAHTKQGSENTLGMAEGFWSLKACSSNTLPNPFLTVPPTAGGAVFTQTTLLHNRRQVSDWLYLKLPQRCPGVGTVLDTALWGSGHQVRGWGRRREEVQGKGVEWSHPSVRSRRLKIRPRHTIQLNKARVLLFFPPKDLCLVYLLGLVPNYLTCKTNYEIIFFWEKICKVMLFSL